jgi:sigma-B regulation protein RsbU (phosphoserine phosphatase)
MRALFRFEEPPAVSVRDLVGSDTLEVHGAELAAVYNSRRIAGDFYDFVRIGPSRILFGVLDVAGALDDCRNIIAAAKQTFRTSGPELFARPDMNEADAMMELCLRLNQVVLKTANGVRSCPAFAGSYDENLGVVCYFNAGHTPGLLRDQAGISELPATGLPLGLFSHMTSDAPMVALEPGAVLLLASRGIVEGKRKSEEFGLARVKNALRESKAASATELGVSVLERVEQFMGKAPTHDDVTAMALSRNSQEASS